MGRSQCTSRQRASTSIGKEIGKTYGGHDNRRTVELHEPPQPPQHVDIVGHSVLTFTPTGARLGCATEARCFARVRVRRGVRLHLSTCPTHFLDLDWETASGIRASCASMTACRFPP